MLMPMVAMMKVTEPMKDGDLVVDAGDDLDRVHHHLAEHLRPSRR